MRWCDVRIPDSSSTGEQNTKADCKVFLLAESGKIEKVPKITMKCFDYLIYMKKLAYLKHIALPPVAAH